MSHIAFLGVGLIGAALATASARRGDAIVAYNRTTSRAEALRPHGVALAQSAVEAVTGAAFVHLALSDDAALDAVLTDALCDALSFDAILIDHTTASPAGVVARAARLARRGVAYLHAPVFMSPQACLDAAGVMLVAGAQPLFERAQGRLEVMTGRLQYLGERADAAASYKLFGNALIIALTAGLADVITMGRQLGFSPEQAYELLAFFTPANTLQQRGRRMAQGDYTPSFELTMARKDVRLMMEAAQGAPLATLPGIAARMDALIEAGHGAQDLGVLATE